MFQEFDIKAFCNYSAQLKIISGDASAFIGLLLCRMAELKIE